jgi:hypothetical protein
MSDKIKSVVVRVLVSLSHQGKNYKPDQLVKLSENDAAVFKEGGTVDDNKAAVDYCRSELKAEVITHVSADAELAAESEGAAAGSTEGA